MPKAQTMIRSLATALAMVSSTAAAAAPATPRMVFVSCPILRNTTLPCWLGESGGKLYYLGPQTDLTSDFYPPQFHHKMLVEADVADGPTICGGIPLKNVTASVLSDFDDSCNVMLPAEGYPDPPNNRGSGPSGVRGGPPPAPTPLYRAPPAFTPPPAPYKAEEFVATFNADSDRKWQPATDAVNKAFRYATAIKAARVEITGYRAAIRLSDGHEFVEGEKVAELRAKTLEEGLTTLGLPKTTKILVTWKTAPLPSAGLGKDAPLRKGVIKVIPGAAAAAGKTADKAASSASAG